jgi:hypothetical protein
MAICGNTNGGGGKVNLIMLHGGEAFSLVPAILRSLFRLSNY